MSEFFIKKFNQQVKCFSCKHSVLKVRGKAYSLCAKHLQQAAERWRCWAEQRRSEGKCISCDKHSYNGWLRCKQHTELNRIKCRRWMAENKEYRAKFEAERREHFLKAGLCLCASHTPLPEGYHRCDRCREKGRKYAKMAESRVQ